MTSLSFNINSYGDVAVARFGLTAGISQLVGINLWVVDASAAFDLSTFIGQPATFRATAGHAHTLHLGTRSWSGIISHAEQVHAVPAGAGQAGKSTYMFRLVPELWRLTHRQNNRIFQHLSIPDIVEQLLREWSIQHAWHIDRAAYPKLELKVQYGESDYSLFSRLLEEAGIAYTFESDESGASVLALSDRLERGPLRPGLPLPCVDNPNEAAEKEFVTQVRQSREVRPGSLSIRDYDPRHPAVPLFAHAPPAGGDTHLEQYHYDAGAFLVETGRPEGAPAADDRGFARHDSAYGQKLATRMLHGDRIGAHAIHFESNAYDLAPGSIFSMVGHPHEALLPSRRLLVVETSIRGSAQGRWTLTGVAVPADMPFRPPRSTPKPRIHGVQSALVVGPAGQEIHTDEYGRVRVELPWDRAGHRNDRSSCWVRVDQGWGGIGYGMLNLPRIGQEVLISFLEGDPDQPVMAGRAFNAVEQVPYRLPAHKTRSAWKSNSSPTSQGFNEIMFEDLANRELVWQQAQKDRTREVENDEHATIAHDRQHLVKNDESEQTCGHRKLWVGGNFDHITRQELRERLEGDAQLEVHGARRDRVSGDDSLTIDGNQQEYVSGSFALRAAKQVHGAAEHIVAEGARDVTVAGPGGFVHIDEAGVTIAGTLVKINVTGKPGKGRGAKPTLPDEPAGPAITNLRWKKAKIGVGQTAEGTFDVAGFKGGEDAIVTIFECDANGKKTILDTRVVGVTKPSGHLRFTWSRSEEEVAHDLLEDEQDEDAGPLEYRFAVRAGPASSQRLSAALWLTNTVRINLLSVRGQSVKGQRMRVSLTGADGTVLHATTENGTAEFKNVVVGTLRVAADAVDEG